MLDELRRDVRSLRLEWDDTYEKLAKQTRKLAKASQRAEADCGCKGKESNGAGPEGGEMHPLALARQRYGDPWRQG